VTGLNPSFDRDLEIHPVRESEQAAAGAATALAYREFAPEGSPEYDAYLVRIADVAARSERATVLVALSHGVVAGSVTLEVDGRFEPDAAEPLAADEAHMRMLGVAPEHRGLGIARRLVIACADLATQRGKTRLTLDTTARMAAAQALYAGLGFQRAGVYHTPGGLELLRYEAALPLAAAGTRAATTRGRDW
jgi:ribosomal protein S18 acetylase RimI-like enzyme